MDHFDSNLDLQQQERRPPIYNAEDYVLGLKKFCKLTGKIFSIIGFSKNSTACLTPKITILKKLTFGLLYEILGIMHFSAETPCIEMLSR